MRSRGTSTNPHNRYAPLRIALEPVDPVIDDVPTRIATSVMAEQARSILSRNTSPDVPFDTSVNPYRGCEHGCIYCFARPSHAYWDLSPGLDFETRLFAKPNAPALLRAAFESKRYQPSVIALGINTDAYQPIEKEWKLTRQLLDIFLEYRHPVSLITKSSLILRDLDLLSALAEQQLCSVRISLTSLDNSIKSTLEPRAAGPAARLRAVRELTAAGVPTGILLAPVIPFINDHEIEAILEAAHQVGAEAANWMMLRLPLEVSGLFEDWLEQHFPQRKQRVMARIRDLRNGATNDSRFGVRMTGEGIYSRLISQRFAQKCRSLGLPTDSPRALRTDLFIRPGDASQLTLF
jgi:DNA repair photolyase